MTNLIKKLISLLLAALLVISVFPVGLSASAEETEIKYKVEIVSFKRGEQADLRSSELLEARIFASTDGGSTWKETDNVNGIPVTQLQYKWTNGLDTYLYIYNAHNMYNINNTEGEISINSSASTTKTGYAWAAVYGANLEAADLLGTVSVEVLDGSGNLLMSDSHTGARINTGTNKRPVYVYSGFVMYDLQEDLDIATFGLFEGDTKSVIDLLGESGIVHITCTASSVTQGTVTDGTEHISISGSGNAYTVIGLAPGESETDKGDATITITIKKENCKFHNKTSATGNVPVYVYKKPSTTTTATTLTLTNLDERCKYYINGVEGSYVDENGDGKADIVIFTGLTPNTDYPVTVKGQAGDAAPVYAYVYDKTKTAYIGTINVYLHTTGNPAGTLTDITDIFGDDAGLMLRLDGDIANIDMNRTDEGIYSATLSTGTFYPYYSTDGENWIKDNQQIVITDASQSKNMDFYAVEYDTDGGTPVPSDRIYLFGESAAVVDTVPAKEGYAFVGWKDQNGNEYAPDEIITDSINTPYQLTAQYVKTTDVYVNFSVDHYDENKLGHNNDSGKYNIYFALAGRDIDSQNGYTELSAGSILWDGTESASVPGYSISGTVNNSERIDETVYEALFPTFSDVLTSMEYTVTTSKSGYSIKNIAQTTAQDGDIIIDVQLIYNPNNFDFTFDVELDEAAKKLPESIKPTAANIKVTSWYDSPYVDGEDVAWFTITQHKDTYVKVQLDSDGKGSGTYPVWITTADEGEYYYRIEVVSYVLPDGSVMDAIDTGNAHTIYATADNRYSAVIETNGCKDPDSTDSSTLTGAWFENNAQHGNVKAVISIEVFNVTFDPNGGTVNGSADSFIVEDQVVVPDLSQYVPVRDGGYVFDGWYLSDGTRKNSGDTLTEDITLIAKWKEPLTVSGTVTVAGYYTLDGTEHTIHNVDRAASVVIVLQRIDGDYVSTQANQTVAVDYTLINEPDVGIGSYSFSGIPDDGKVYRVDIVSANYDTLFRNEPASESYSAYHSDYNKKDYMAVFGSNNISTADDESKEAVVDTFLEFVPNSFDLKYSVDATKIGTGFRPELAEILVLYNDGLKGNNPQNWATISQMVFDGGHIGQDTFLNDGTGSNGYSVWNNNPSGELYDYAVLLNKYAGSDGVKHLFDEAEAPFAAAYNGSARYDNLSNLGQTQLLTVILEPKIYSLSFDLAFDESDEDNIGTSMEDYLLIDGSYGDSHTWSYPTEVTAAPVRPGYQFLGWFEDTDGDRTKDADEPYVTGISAETHRDIALTAHWLQSQDTVNVTVIIDHTQTGSNTGNAGNWDKELTIQLTETERGSQNGIYSDTAGHCVQTSEWHSNGNSERDEYAESFTGLSSSFDYSANVTLDGYYEAGKSVEWTENPDGSRTYNITVTMKYNPELLNFDFRVEMAEDVPQSLYPVSAEVKVTCWYDAPADGVGDLPLQWNTITQHRSSSVTVYIDPVQGFGTGTYPVWQWLSKEDGTPYYYRIEIVAVTLSDGTIIPMTEQNDDTTYMGQNYTAVVHTDDHCSWSAVPGTTETTELKGAYGKPKTMTVADDYVESLYTQDGEVWAVIDVDAYTVTVNPNGGAFTDGTTAAKEFTEQIKMPSLSGHVPERTGYEFSGWDKSAPSEGEWLTGNVTLTAQWTPIEYSLTYISNGGDISGEYLTKYTVSDAVTHPQDVTKENFVFGGWYENSDFHGTAVTGFGVGTIGDKTYYAKWLPQQIGYTVEYYYDGILDSDKTASLTAEYGSVVNTFEPQPKNSFIFDRTENLPLNITAGSSENVIRVYYASDVWADGDAADSDNITEDSTSGGDNIPDYKQALVRFEAAENGTVSGPVLQVFTFENSGGTYSGTVTPEDVYTVPSVGYSNEKWTLNSGSEAVNPFTAQKLNGSEEYLYTAFFKQDKFPYVVEYFYDDIKDEDATVSGTGVLGAEIPAAERPVTDFILEQIVGQGNNITTNASDNIVKLYYSKDAIGGGENGSESDDIPDKYQKKVIFKVVNGTWSDGKTSDIVTYATLLKDGKWDKDGTASITAPTGMKANDGFKNGSWDMLPPATVSGTDTVTYTYGYVRSTTPVSPSDVIGYITEHYKAGENGEYTVSPTDIERSAAKVGQTVTGVPKEYEGYCLNAQVSTMSGTIDVPENYGDIVILKLYYDIDTVGGGENGSESDDIPDKYQKKVIFKVVNGTWSDGKTSDIVTYATLLKDGKWDKDGTASLTAPTGMKANVGYTQVSGEWDSNPPTAVRGTSAQTFSYSFDPVGGSGDSPDSDKEFTITASATNGTVSSASVKAKQGETKTITFSAKKGYKLGTVTVDGSAASLTDNGYTFSNIKADHSIAVTFVKDESQTKTVSYTVRHMSGSTVLTSETYTQNVWVNDDDKAVVSADSIAQKSFSGYIYNGMDTQVAAGAKVASGTVITLNYKVDDGKGPVPDTGDNGNTSNIVLCANVMFIAVMIAVATVPKRRNKRRA